jgi:hypothetical protein
MKAFPPRPVRYGGEETQGMELEVLKRNLPSGQSLAAKDDELVDPTAPADAAAPPGL